jgi:hypothetical protein
MESANIVTVAKMLETLPESMQNQVVDRLRDYIAEMQDDARWDILFRETNQQLVAFAQKAKQEIKSGKAKPMDYSKL